MTSIKSIFAGIAFAMTLSLGGQPAQAADQVISRGQISQTGVVALGTPAYETIRQFIIQNSVANQHRALDKASTLPASFSVVHTTVIRSSSQLARTQDMGGYPPVGLPGTGNDGDTLSISSCGDHLSETWTYLWVGPSIGGGWVLQKYTWTVVTKCKDMTAQ